MKGFKDSTRTMQGHNFGKSHGFSHSTGGTINRLAQGGKVGGLTEHESDLNGHSAVQRSESSTQELAEHGGKTPLTSGYKHGGKVVHKHFHVHHHGKGGKIHTKSYEREAEHKAEGGHIYDDTRPEPPDYAKGGKPKHWIAGATKNKGALHRALHVPEGEKIPAKKLAKAEHSKNPTMRKRAALAETLKGMQHKATGGTINPVATGGTINRLNAGGALYATGGTINRLAMGAQPVVQGRAMPMPTRAVPQGVLGQMAARPMMPAARPAAMPAGRPIMRAQGGMTVAEHVRSPAPMGHKGMGSFVRRGGR
jgi:hypothetical protein